MSESVGSALLDEIERVSAKRERWKQMQQEMGPALGRGMAPGIMMMGAAINAGKAALQSDDPADAIRALEALRAYDNED